MAALYPYQQQSARALASALARYGAALDCSDTGTGKTYVAAALAAVAGKGVAVICPKNVIPVWTQVLAMFGAKPIFVLNYELLRRGGQPYGKWVKKRFEWNPRIPRNTILIWDEVHRCKNGTSKNAKMLKAAGPLFLNLMLSATAAESPLDFRVTGEVLGLFKADGFYWWARDHGCVSGGFSVLELSKKPEEVTTGLTAIHAALFKPHAGAPPRGVRVRADSIPGFPPSHVITQPWDFGDNKKIEALYAEMQRELDALNRVITEDDYSHLTICLRYRQETELLKVPQLVETAVDLIDQGKSVVVFVNFRATLAAVVERLGTKAGGVSVIQGVTGKKEEAARNEAIRAFQANENRIAVVNIAAGGASISLHDLHGTHPRVSLVCAPFDAIQLKQALGRTPRSGGTKVTQYIPYVAGTIEERVLEVAMKKIAQIDLLNDGERYNIPSNVEQGRQTAETVGVSTPLEGESQGKILENQSGECPTVSREAPGRKETDSDRDTSPKPTVSSAVQSREGVPELPRERPGLPGLPSPGPEHQDRGGVQPRPAGGLCDAPTGGNRQVHTTLCELPPETPREKLLKNTLRGNVGGITYPAHTNDPIILPETPIMLTGGEEISSVNPEEIHSDTSFSNECAEPGASPVDGTVGAPAHASLISPQSGDDADTAKECDSNTGDNSDAASSLVVVRPVHAKHGPSGLKLKERCARQINPGGTNPMAERGTVMHAALETDDDSALVDPAELEYVASCRRIIGTLLRKYNKNRPILADYREISLDMDLGDEVRTYGTCDRLFLFGDDTGLMLDYKFGFWAVDDAEKNPQAWAYVLGAFQQFPHLHTIHFYFLLPRRNEVTFFTFTRHDVRRIRTRLRAIIDAAEDPNAPEQPGVGLCEFCLRSQDGSCDAFRGVTMAIAGAYDPLVIPAVVHGSQISDVVALSHLLLIAPALDKAVKGWRKRAKELGVKGVAVPGFRVTTVAGDREITSSQAAWELVKKMLTPAEFASCADISASKLLELYGSKFPRGMKGQARQTLEDQMTDSGILERGAGTLTVVRNHDAK